MTPDEYRAWQDKQADDAYRAGMQRREDSRAQAQARADETHAIHQRHAQQAALRHELQTAQQIERIRAAEAAAERMNQHAVYRSAMAAYQAYWEDDRRARQQAVYQQHSRDAYNHHRDQQGIWYRLTHRKR